jgi:dipeptidyl aminopeptidase/acylaminoacyl peptidase
MRAGLRVAVVTILCVGGAPASRDASAQYFGKNKVEYVDFGFRVLATPHFDIYYYPDEQSAAHIAARLAERWYARFSRVLAHEFTNRQPLILYASQPEFSQTNVISGPLGEGIGGVTEFQRGRIVMPFAPTMWETDRVLGHEIAHAFQLDVAKRHGGRYALPAWAIEGMAQYLSLGGADAETAMWLRDAVAQELLPAKADAAARKFSPYRYGHAFWAYVAGRFGDRTLRDVLTAGRSKNFSVRVEKATGLTLEQVFHDWREAARAAYDREPVGTAPRSPLLRGPRTGNVALGPVLSPDGKSAAFFSERDRFSLDLFLADTDRGVVTRKLATTAASAALESLQALRSAGAWNARGDHLVFAAIRHGTSQLVVLDVARRKSHHIDLPGVGQVLSPSWSPDGRWIAFASLEGGFTDLFVYDTVTESLSQLTDDAFSDLQPVWSPDGREIVFSTDRFSTDLDTLTFGPCGLAVVDVATKSIRRLPAIDAAKHVNPQWSSDGHSVFFLSDPSGITNVFRLDLRTGSVFQVTRVATGITGLTATSPAMTLARDVPKLAYTLYRAGRYEIDVVEGASALVGERVDQPIVEASVLPGAASSDDVLARVLADARLGLDDRAALTEVPYAPGLSLEGIGQPYLTSGGGPFGSFVRGGGALLFGDMLGEQKLGTSVQVGNHLRDFAMETRYLNREHRWNWGGIAELQPYVQRLYQSRLGEVDGQPVLSQSTEYLQQTQVRLAGLLAYPLSHARRLEFTLGARHSTYRTDTWSRNSSLSTRRVVSNTHTEAASGTPSTLAETSVALVGDTAVFGPTSPILGSRYRFEVAPAIGNLSLVNVLADYRRYVMPVKPYTLAVRLLHSGRYGPDADDDRLLSTFLGSPYFMRGYGWDSLQCQWDANGNCTALEQLVSNRIVVGNLEMRFPVPGFLSRDLKYGVIPVEGFAFTDNGVAWARRDSSAAGRVTLVRSLGVGARVNALGFPLEVAAIRAVDAPARGWSFGLTFRPGF